MSVDEHTPYPIPEVIRDIPIRTERGIPLLRAIWEDIKRDPSAWNQTVHIGLYEDCHVLSDAVVEYIRINRRPPWDCGTAACIAGHAVLAAGALLPATDAARIRQWGGRYGRPFNFAYVVDPSSGAERSVEWWARELLGLNLWQADALFAANNDAEYIERFVCELERNPKYVDPGFVFIHDSRVP